MRTTDKPQDLLANIRTATSSLDEAATRSRLDAIISAEPLSYYELGALLHRVQQEAWFGERDNFADWVVHDLRYEPSAAKRAISMYVAITEAELTSEDIRGVNQTALTHLKRVIKSKDRPTIERFIKLARTKPVSVLKEHVRNHFSKDRDAVKRGQSALEALKKDPEHDTKAPRLREAEETFIDRMKHLAGRLADSDQQQVTRALQLISTMYPSLVIYGETYDPDTRVKTTFGTKAEERSQGRDLELGGQTRQQGETVREFIERVGRSIDHSSDIESAEGDQTTQA